LTSFRPDELDVSVEQLKELGYDEDIHGEPLEDESQVIELKIQDIVLSDDSAEHLVRVANFIDDLLVEYYDSEPYYNVDDREDLVGELVMGLAPHTSAGVLGRVVGFTPASVGYAHPFFHAAKRRNCFHPDTKMWLEEGNDGLKYERIEDFVERHLDNPREDDFGTLVQELEGDDEEIYVPSVDDDGNLVKKRVEAVSKHVAPDHLVEIETRSGRSLSVTPDHKMQVYDTESGEIREKKAFELSEDDSLITPCHLDAVEQSSKTHFDLLEELVQTPDVDNSCLMIKGLERDELYTA
ncbi:MAG: type III effector protein, partial [Halobacteria archaeon]|nr:type III effector protein [Halobacteria archaeon]